MGMNFNEKMSDNEDGPIEFNSFKWHAAKSKSPYPLKSRDVSYHVPASAPKS